MNNDTSSILSRKRSSHAHFCVSSCVMRPVIHAKKAHPHYMNDFYFFYLIFLFNLAFILLILIHAKEARPRELSAILIVLFFIFFFFKKK